MYLHIWIQIYSVIVFLFALCHWELHLLILEPNKNSEKTNLFLREQVSLAIAVFPLCISFPWEHILLHGPPSDLKHVHFDLLQVGLVSSFKNSHCLIKSCFDSQHFHSPLFVSMSFVAKPYIRNSFPNWISKDKPVSLLKAESILFF